MNNPSSASSWIKSRGETPDTTMMTMQKSLDARSTAQREDIARTAEMLQLDRSRRSHEPNWQSSNPGQHRIDKTNCAISRKQSAGDTSARRGVFPPIAQVSNTIEIKTGAAQSAGGEHPHVSHKTSSTRDTCTPDRLRRQSLTTNMCQMMILELKW